MSNSAARNTERGTSGFEFATAGILKERSELFSIGLASAFMIDVFANDLMAGAPLAKLSKLVLRVLAFVICADAGVDRNAHLLPTYGTKRPLIPR
jgi:hypothetical protein